MKVKIIPLAMLAVFSALMCIGLVSDGIGKSDAYAPDSPTEWDKLLGGFGFGSLAVGLGLFIIRIVNDHDE